MAAQVVTMHEPCVPVYSRVSWGALLAGATVSLAVYSLLTMLGIAIGFTVSDRMDANELGMGAGIWAFVALLFSLFLGGWVSTQCTVGENRTEAILYGMIVWGLASSMLLWLTAAGLTMGYGTVLAERGLPVERTATAVTPPMLNAERMGRNETAADRTEQVGRTGEDNSQRALVSEVRVRDRLRAASWWTFAGTLLSMLAAIGGALLGPYEFVVRREYRTTTVRPMP